MPGGGLGRHAVRGGLLVDEDAPLGGAGALYAAFLAISVGAGVPPLLAALAFAFLSNVMIPLTHYGGSAGPIIFGANYVTQSEWWKMGFVLTTVNVVVWLGIGGVWWKILGLW